jgi:methyl-accepting chemotaxis protein
MPKNAPEGYKLERKRSITQLFIGVFGAMAILGVMAKIFTFEAEIFGYLVTWKPVVLVGFMGEALVFILMGTMREMRYVPEDRDEPQSSSKHGDPEKANGFDSELKAAEEKLTEETQRLAQQVREMRKDLSGQITVLEEFNQLRSALESATDGLSEHSDALETSMEDLGSLYQAQTSMVQSVEEVQKQLSEESKGLGDEIEETREAMEILRREFAEAARRFQQFNAPPSEDGHSANEQTNNVPHSVK